MGRLLYVGACALLVGSGCASLQAEGTGSIEVDDGLRSSYRACVEAAGGVVPSTQQCIEAETDHQQGLLVAAESGLRLRRGEVWSTYGADKREWEAVTANECRWDAATEGQGQRLDANECVLRRLGRWVRQAERRLK